jgi:hypothetical protein
LGVYGAAALAGDGSGLGLLSEFARDYNQSSVLPAASGLPLTATTPFKLHSALLSRVFMEGGRWGGSGTEREKLSATPSERCVGPESWGFEEKRAADSQTS